MRGKNQKESGVGIETKGRRRLLEEFGRNLRYEVHLPLAPVKDGGDLISREVHDFSIKTPTLGEVTLPLCLLCQDHIFKNLKQGKEGWGITTVKVRGADDKLILDDDDKL